MSQAEKILTEARACIGTPFRHQGRIPGVGLDCAGLLVVVARAIGAEVRDVPAYGRNPAGGLLEATLDAQPCLERVADRQPGDLLLMRFASAPQHLAVFAGDTIIHSYQQVGQVCEHRLAGVWAARIVRAYRFREVA